MKKLKIILGTLLSLGMLFLLIPALYRDIGTNTDTISLFGDGFQIILFGILIYYFFSTINRQCKKVTDQE